MSEPETTTQEPEPEWMTDREARDALSLVAGILAGRGDVSASRALRRVLVSFIQATADRDEARTGYHVLDKNWQAVHNTGVEAFRKALDAPDNATIPEMCLEILRLRGVLS